MADSHPREDADGAASRAGWLALASWARSHPRLAAIGGAGVLAAGIGAIGLLALVFPSTADSQATLSAAMELMRAGKMHEARQMAAVLRESRQISYSERGAVLYILGRAAAADAELHTNPREQHLLNLVASRYLDESRLCGFPAGEENEALYLLGRCLVRAGRSGEAIPILKQALAVRPKHRRELLDLLTRASLGSQPPQFSQALKYSRRYLASKELTKDELDLGRLREGEIHLALGDVDAGRAALAPIRDGSPARLPSILLLVRLLLLEADQLAKGQGADSALQAEIHDALHSAIASLEETVRTPRVDNGLKMQAYLLQAICYARLDEQGKAVSLFVRIRRAGVGSPIALAAAIFEADLHLASGRLDEALEIYRRALRDAGSAEAESNPWLSKEELESHLTAAFQRYVEDRDFGRAVELARLLPPLLSETLSYQWRAQAQHGWAEQLLMQAARQPSAAADGLLTEARSHYRQAGADYERLAELRILTRHYLEDLSRSGADYLAGQGYSQAARVYRTYLQSEPQEGQPEALTGLGEALLSVGYIEPALAALGQCADLFPKHPASYKARLLASLGHQERGQLLEAEKLLLDNLYNFSLTPDSAEWRDSLFALGKLRYRQGLEVETRSRQAGVDSPRADLKRRGMTLLKDAHTSFQEAIRYLDEAIRRYPQAALAVEARYLLAESYRHAAKWPRKQLDLVTIESSKIPLVRQMQEDLASAAAEYGILIEQLANDRDGKGQSRLEQAILRNSYFSRADSLFDMGRYDEAAEAYSAATNRYQNEPESLAAYVQIAACYRRQDRLSEARGTLEQARLVLERMRRDADFTQTTPYSREEWDNLLTWLGAL